MSAMSQVRFAIAVEWVKFRSSPVTLLSGVLALPCALVAVLTRGYLASIGAIVGIVVLAQLAVLSGVGGWFPFAAPGVWAAGVGSDGSIAVQLLLVLPIGALSVWITMICWRHLTLSR